MQNDNILDVWLGSERDSASIVVVFKHVTAMSIELKNCNDSNWRNLTNQNNILTWLLQAPVFQQKGKQILSSFMPSCIIIVSKLLQKTFNGDDVIFGRCKVSRKTSWPNFFSYIRSGVWSQGSGYEGPFLSDVIDLIKYVKPIRFLEVAVLCKIYCKYLKKKKVV